MPTASSGPVGLCLLFAIASLKLAKSALASRSPLTYDTQIMMIEYYGHSFLRSLGIQTYFFTKF